jgi:hypothetical protein
MRDQTPKGIRRSGVLLAAAMLGIGLLAAPVFAQQAERGDNRGDRRGMRGDRGDRGRGMRPGRGGAWRRGPGGPFAMGRLVGGFGEMLQPDFLRRDMAIFVRELELDRGQQAILETLLIDYEAEFTAAAGEVREELTALRRALFNEMRELGREIRERRRNASDDQPLDPAYLEQVQARFAEMRAKLEELRPEPPDDAEIDRLRDEAERILRRWRLERANLRSEFLANVRVALNEAQLQRWPEFERALRRTKSIGRGRLAGEEVDLFLVLTELDVDADAMGELRDTLTNYAIELDQALKARDAFIDEGRLDFIGFLVDQQFDAAIDYMNRESTLRVAVRDTNERYAELIANGLEAVAGAETAEAFRSAYRERAFERIFRPTRTQRAFEAAREIEGLDEDVLAAIRALEEGYLLELARINNELVLLTLKHEPQQITQRLRWRAERGNDRNRGAGPGVSRRLEDPIREAFGRRGELDARYRDQLEALLTPEQIELLPAERRGRGGWNGRRGGGDAGRQQRFRDALQRFDTDGDGELSEEERQAARESFRRRMQGGGQDG